MKYRVFIGDRSYSSWSFVNTQTEITEELPEIQPLHKKMFSRDIIENGEIVYSHVKSGVQIPGILILEGNKTYGRTANKKRLYYKCIPDDCRLPIFIVPYEIKIGFSKSIQNKYVVFKFDQWSDQHPCGQLVETIGDVSDLNALYEYQLYCKDLHISLSEFTSKTREQLHKKTIDEYIDQIENNPEFCIENRKMTHSVFTIDPKGSTDFDDGFSIVPWNYDGLWNHGGHIVSIYIANVYFWLETLGLWSSFSKRVATVYLPDRRCPMLPTILSDTLCSLQEKTTRFAFVMDIYIDSTGVIVKTEYTNASIHVYRNYEYEDRQLIHKDENYQKLFEITRKLDKNMRNSHDLVAYWMITMNRYTGIHLANNKTGIFRSVNYISTDFDENIDTISDQDAVRVIRQWNNTTGQYVFYNDQRIAEHEIMELTSYIHITSPIRRLVDLLNVMLFMNGCTVNTQISNSANIFLQKWMGELEYINQSMRSIRKIQMECSLLEKVFKEPLIMEREHAGIVFDKMQRNDGTFVYMVYLFDQKLLSRIYTEKNMENYTKANFRIYLFESEDKIKKKIRLQIYE